MHYRVIFHHLNKFLLAPCLAKKDHVEVLNRWDALMTIFYTLVTVPKKLASRVIISVLLKQARIFVDAAVKHCMPIMDKLFSHGRALCVQYVHLHHYYYY